MKILLVICVILLFCDLNVNNPFFVEAPRPKCFSDEPNPVEFFLPYHYDDVGYPRDVCVELVRSLLIKLKLSDNKLCSELANIQTSSRIWHFLCYKKWSRLDGQHEDVSEEIMNKAINMIKNFNEEVYVNHKIVGVDKQDTFLTDILVAQDQLKRSKVANDKSDIIKEMEEMKNKFCSDYLKVKAEKERQRLEEEAGAERKYQELGIEEEKQSIEAEANLEAIENDSQFFETLPQKMSITEVQKAIHLAEEEFEKQVEKEKQRLEGEFSKLKSRENHVRLAAEAEEKRRIAQEQEDKQKLEAMRKELEVQAEQRKKEYENRQKDLNPHEQSQLQMTRASIAEQEQQKFKELQITIENDEKKRRQTFETEQRVKRTAEDKQRTTVALMKNKYDDNEKKRQAELQKLRNQLALMQQQLQEQ